MVMRAQGLLAPTVDFPHLLAPCALLRLCYAHKRKDLIETHLQPAILDQCDKWKKKLQKRLSRFQRHKDRLPVARGIMRARMQDAEVYGGTTISPFSSSSSPSCSCSSFTSALLVRRPPRR